MARRILWQALEGPSRVQVKTSSVLHSSIEPVISPQKVVRLVRHDLPMAHPCWLFSVTFPSFGYVDTAFRKTGSVIFVGIQVRQIGQ